MLFRLRQQEGLSQVDLADVLELQPISLVRLLDRLRAIESTLQTLIEMKAGSGRAAKVRPSKSDRGPAQGSNEAETGARTGLILLAFTNGKMAADPDTKGEMVSAHFTHI
jgi:hypothetical protein